MPTIHIASLYVPPTLLSSLAPPRFLVRPQCLTRAYPLPSEGHPPMLSAQRHCQLVASRSALMSRKGHGCLSRDADAAVGRFVMSCQV
jgi:hypothetical protein